MLGRPLKGALPAKLREATPALVATVDVAEAVRARVAGKGSDQHFMERVYTLMTGGPLQAVAETQSSRVVVCQSK